MERLILVCLTLVCGQAWAERVVYLTQEDFRHGSYVVTEPGRYVLAEDVRFNPNGIEALTALCDQPAESLTHAGLRCPMSAYQAGRPLPSQLGRVSRAGAPESVFEPHYDASAFGLGFFAAIVVAADDVVIDLNGFRLEQGSEHALLQRFFALIELADRPFVPRQGPADFGARIRPAERVRIENGVLGRSAHHGIHGNDNRHVLVRDVHFDGYEVAALALNGVQGLRVLNARASNRQDVPVLGTFSAARFLTPYVEHLVRNHGDLKLGERSVGEVRDGLKRAIEAVHADVVLGRGFIDPDVHPHEAALFGNPQRVVDGNAYGFLINPPGVAVNGFPLRAAEPARDVVFRNVTIERQVAFVNEVVALGVDGVVVTDPVGAVVQLRNRDLWGRPLTMDEQGGYRGNVLSDAQILVGKAIAEGRFADTHLDVSRGHLPSSVVRWAEGEGRLDDASWLCNGDSMFHVNKGVIGFKIDGARDVRVRNVEIGTLLNLGRAGSEICGAYRFSHPQATLAGYGGAVTRGISVAGSERVRIRGVRIGWVEASAGSAVGVDVLTDTRQVAIDAVQLGTIRAGLGGETRYVPPNSLPHAHGLRAGPQTRAVTSGRICADRLVALGSEQLIAGDVRKRHQASCIKSGRSPGNERPMN